MHRLSSRIAPIAKTVWNAPETRPSILLRVRDPSDQEAWRIFESVYGPVIFRVARSRGLQDCDANDVAQVVLTRLSRQPWGFDPDSDRGRFRTWLSRVTEHAVVDHLRKQRRDIESVTSLDQFAFIDGHPVEQLELEYRREVFEWAARIVRREFSVDAWRSFWMTAVEAQPVPSVAIELNRSIGSVYTSRSRIMRRLKEQVNLFDEELDQEL